MPYRFESHKVKSKFLGHKIHLIVRTEDGRVIDHFSGRQKGIKKASFLDQISFQGKRVMLDGKVHTLKSKSLNSYFIRNGTRLSFDCYGSQIHKAVSKGFSRALRHLPNKGFSRAEVRGKMLLKCIEHYCNPTMNRAPFPYDQDPTQFKKNYKDPLKWERFFINLWKTKVRKSKRD